MGHESFDTPVPAVEEPLPEQLDETVKSDKGEMSNESWPASATAEAYEEYEEPPEVRAYNERKQEYKDTISQWNTHIEAALAGDEATLDHDELAAGIDTRERMKQELMEVSANYPGDWTGLLYERMADPVSKEKFIAQRTEAIPVMKDGGVGMLVKTTDSKDRYKNQIDTYDETLAKVFSYTRVNNERPHVLGSSEGVGDPGVVYSGAHKKDGTPLTPRQKNIIEAHEKGHGLRDFESPLDTREIRLVIDEEQLAELSKIRRAEKDPSYNSTYIREPIEIIERMAQFKNYFGMGAQDTFEKKHLDHIRAHYVTDTGLDNGVTNLLTCVTPQTEAAFISVINKYPI